MARPDDRGSTGSYCCSGSELQDGETGKATDLIQGEKTVTVSVVVPCVLSLHCHLQGIRGRVRYCGPLWLKHDVQLDSDDKDQLMTQIIDCIKAEGEKQMISTADTAAGPEQGDVPVSPPEAPQKKLRMFSHYSKTPSSTNSLSVFSIPASSAPIERVFSHGGIFMRPHRARLSCSMLSNLMLLKCNMHV
ncbi:hypothetical protein JOQ06_012030 [Pogonophryne albipinna]|uniref:HAT C-terminal dimerisation domain-containing protein n=1 Tax=Pogonophryne albipinna TaxID=1090488 RepID=A0AAD6BDW4_9TELE|nr:hypothetical protein JOQ06_012030 [Pogonophryne albipinna]